MISMLLAYDAQELVIATLDHMVARDDEGDVIGLIDFAAHEDAGGKLRDVWFVESVGDGLAGLPLAYQCPGGPDVGHNDDRHPLNDCPGGEWRQPARGSGCWPEWIGGHAYEFRVELVGPPAQKRIAALVHVGMPETDDHPAVPGSGHRRDRAAIEAAIQARIEGAPTGALADISDLVGGPGRPLPLDAEGRTAARRVSARGPRLPMIVADSSPSRSAGPSAPGSQSPGGSSR